MVHADGIVRTDDMALACVLFLHGHNPVMELHMGSNGHKYVIWTIPAHEVDDDVEDLIDDFVRGAVRVEPKRYTYELREVRKRMYALLGHDKAARGTRLPRATRS